MAVLEMFQYFSCKGRSLGALELVGSCNGSCGNMKSDAVIEEIV